MRKTPVIFLLMFLSIPSFSQDENNTRHHISAGYGYGTFVGEFNNYMIRSSSFRYLPTGPFFIKYAYTLSSQIETGLNLAWLHEEFSLNYTSTNVSIHTNNKFNSYSVLLRFNYFIWNSKAFQFYTGAGIGFRNRTTRYRDEVKGVYIYENVPQPYPIGFEMTIGERFYITKNIGIYAEAGFAKAAVQGGITCAF